MAKLFGTDGVRGKANIYPMTPDFAVKLGQVAGLELATKYKRVAIGKDTRISGDMLESALVSGFTSVGVDVVLLGVLPTPAVSYYAQSLDVDLAIIISASHNPYFDNGIKMKDGEGETLPKSVTNLLEQKIGQEIELNPERIGRVIYNHEVYSKYVKSFEKFASLKGLKVVIDSANGAFSSIASGVLKNLGAEVVAIGNEPNGININMGCGSTKTDLMCQTVVETKANIGIALDGDGDRIVVADEKGNRVNCDQLIAFLATYFKEENKLSAPAVVTTELSNMGISKYAKSLGLTYYATGVGEQCVVEKLIEIGANVGGEESGHIVLRDYSKSGDGLVVGISLCEALLKTKKKMNEVFPIFEMFPMTINNVRFETKEKASAAVDSSEAVKIIEECKQKLGTTGSLIVRKSGTEPIIRLYIQGEDKKILDEVTQIMLNLVEKGK
ncbi:MAG: phosphoglucosamine mutase [Alphaproteobacteria bacterium]